MASAASLMARFRGALRIAFAPLVSRPSQTAAVPNMPSGSHRKHITSSTPSAKVL